jgi:hypothetical protein
MWRIEPVYANPGPALLFSPDKGQYCSLKVFSSPHAVTPAKAGVQIFMSMDYLLCSRHVTPAFAGMTTPVFKFPLSMSAPVAITWRFRWKKDETYLLRMCGTMIHEAQGAHAI